MVCEDLSLSNVISRSLLVINLVSEIDRGRGVTEINKSRTNKLGAIRSRSIRSRSKYSVSAARLETRSASTECRGFGSNLDDRFLVRAWIEAVWGESLLANK